MNERPGFRLRLLGYPALSAADGGPVAGLGPGKPLALLAYLAVRGEARRDELVDLLWGEVSEANARNAFRQALHRLRSALGEDLIPLDPDRVVLDFAGGLENDRQEFIQALDRNDVVAAVETYRGDFLEGFELGEPAFDTWADAERTRLRSRFQLALQGGAESALASGRWLEALQHVQRLTTLAPYDESAAILEANVLVAAGRGTEAHFALRRFTQSMREQLDLPPSQRVRDMMSRIERADAQRESQPPQKARQTRFVGREPEIARMMTLARGLGAERGALAVIEGPTGIGKSRLVAEFITRTRTLGPLLVLRGRERPPGNALPYASIAEALRGALRAPGVSGTGRHLLAEAARLLPELRDSFDLPDPGPIDEEGGRLRFFEGVAALLDSAAYEQPVCVVLEEMHNASALTIDLVDYLGARLHSSPVLLVLMFGDESNSPALRRIRETARTLTESERAIVLELGSLDAEATRDLITTIVHEEGVEGQLDVEQIVAASAGNPLRAIELTKRALDGEQPGRHPTPLRDVLWARLQRASPSQRRVFFAAALLQRRCSLRLLSAAAHLPELAALEAARHLEEAGLLSEDGDSYVISHDFTSSFVIDASGRAGRAMLAGWAADALAADRGGTSAELASLYAVAGQQGPAFTHARQAVYEAAALGAGSEVNRLLGVARTLAPDARTREQVESLLAAFGSGLPLLEAPVKSVDAVPLTDVASASTPPTPSAAPPDRAEPRAFLTTRMAALVVVGLMAVATAITWSRSFGKSAGQRSLRDSLLVVARGMERGTSAFVITGTIDDAGRSTLSPVVRDSMLPSWAQSLQLPWIRPSMSAAGTVAAELMTETGTDVYLLGGPGIAPVPVATGPGTDAVVGWSPDGRSLLVRRSKLLADGSFDADLWSFHVGGDISALAIDTSALRLVEDEAQWSPDGSRIAWVAQVGTAHQRDVFVARADGSDILNVTDNPAEDFHVGWSSDGNLLAFTSDRDGNQDLFAIDLGERSRRLWRLTNSPADEDLASFSPDRRFVAFQSTAAGDAAVYVMPALGGTAARVTPAGGQFSIAGWRGDPPEGYVDRVRIIGPSNANVGDTVRLSVFATDARGNRRNADGVSMVLLDTSAAVLRRRADSMTSHALVPRMHGPVSVIASIPGWRVDTLVITIGAGGSQQLSDDFSNGISRERWIERGVPRPSTRAEGTRWALYPNADLQWESGLLSRSIMNLTDSVDVAATFNAPFDRPIAGASLVLALVDADARVDSIAPQPVVLASIQWDGESSRLTYSLGSQSKSDPLSTLGQAESHRARLTVSPRGDVAFIVGGRVRWTSSLRFLGATTDRRARLWIGGKATGGAGSIRDLVVSRP